MVRVYLDEWEWDCCGEPFGVGDTVTLEVYPPNEELRSMLGGELGESLDLVESHHEIGPDDPPTRTLAGVVRALSGLAVDYVEHHEPRLPTPTPLAPEFVSPEPRAPFEGVGWFASAPNAAEPPYTIVSTPVDGTGRAVSVQRVPAIARDNEPADAAGVRPAEPVMGYLIEVEPA